MKTRWPEGVTCSRCGSRIISRISTRDKFECARCEYQFTAPAGTIFHKTYIPLPKWFLAIYLMNSGREISVNQLSRDLSLPYKTAWSMAQRIRSEMKNQEFTKLAGLFVN